LQRVLQYQSLKVSPAPGADFRPPLMHSRSRRYLMRTVLLLMLPTLTALPA
jgi:hypothetical protein